MSYKHDSSINKKRLKVVIVGDGACGKTCMLHVFRKGVFPLEYEYIPTIFENWVADMTIDNTKLELELWDTAGQEDYDRLRHLSYADANVVLICFGVDSPDSLENVEEKWNVEVNHHTVDVPVLLVALKKDLREDKETIKQLEQDGQMPTTPAMGEAMCKKIQARAYLECSAKRLEGVQEVFEAAARAGLEAENNGRNACCIIL